MGAICEHCGALDINKLLRETAGEKLPQNVRFFDFGDGLMSMSVIAENWPYTTKSLSVLIEQDPESKITRCLPFTYKLNSVPIRDRANYIVSVAMRALERFEQDSKPIVEGDRFPPPIHIE